MHPPEADLKTAKPKHIVFGAVGVVAGLMSVAAIVLYLLIFRESIITPESLERTLNIRVLGAVPDVA
jgi:capsular polysaccharide biosynthesis protein